MVKVTINGNIVEAPKGLTVLEVCNQQGIKIPTFCKDKRLIADGSCRICVVEVTGTRALQASCSTPIFDGMHIQTHSERVTRTRKDILDLMWAGHGNDCLNCEKAGKCKLQDYCFEYGVQSEKMVYPQKETHALDHSNEFFTFNRNKCILCGQCVRTCAELQGTSAIGFSGRGQETHITHPFENGMMDSDCVSCGNCIHVCPTGALMEKKKMGFREWDIDKKVHTTCSYCGVGCQMSLAVKENRVVRVDPIEGHVNDGLLCVKGKFGYRFIDHADRLKTPLIKKDGAFVPASWDEALALVGSKLLAIKGEHGPDAIAGLASARCTNEENYLLQKMMRAAIGTQNVDHCARLCHASTVSGLATTLGSGAMTNSIAEMLESDCFFVTGSNTTENHPVIATFMLRAVKKGALLIVADPRRIELAKHADVYMQIKPGTNVALLNGMMSVILKENLIDTEFIADRTEDFDALATELANWNPERAAEICGINAQDIIKAARLYAKAKKASIFYSMGITQHSDGTNHVMSISNLALMCGHLGKESSGVNPLRGQNNVQGACDMGALPNVYPGYQPVASLENKEKFEKAWGISGLSTEMGLRIPEMLDAATSGDLKAIYILGENPMVSDPDIHHVEKALESLDFLVVQDIFLTETAMKADVVLPAACFAEKDGTFTNTERRVQRVRKAVEAPGEAMADWYILDRVMNALGYQNNFESAEDVMEEINALTPIYGGISYKRLDIKGLQWPCPTLTHEGTKFLHNQSFSRGKGLFKAIQYKTSAELPDETYPMILTTGRVLYHYHTRSMTGRVEGLNKMSPESFIEISPTMAKKHAIVAGDMVTVKSRRGCVVVRAMITDRVNDEVVFMPFHFAEGAANMLTNSALDPVACIPELKVCAVSIEKVV